MSHLILDDGGEGHEVEQVGKVSPHIGSAVLAKTLVIESINLCYLS